MVRNGGVHGAVSPVDADARAAIAMKSPRGKVAATAAAVASAVIVIAAEWCSRSVRVGQVAPDVVASWGREKHNSVARRLRHRLGIATYVGTSFASNSAQA